MKRMNLQLFAEPTGGAGGTEPPAGGQNQQQTQTQTGQQASLAIDYAKIQQMLEGTLAAKEDTALKPTSSSRAQPGRDGAGDAAFKQQKRHHNPDVAALQQQAPKPRPSPNRHRCRLRQPWQRYPWELTPRQSLMSSRWLI